MIRFVCDYSEGAHPEILRRLSETNLEQTPGYGEDAYCRAASERIRALCACPEAGVHFLVGGTQVNLTVIASVLRPWQGVVCADTGHIQVHETGAIEATGHKVLALAGREGKISAEDIRRCMEAHWGDVNHEHTVQPGMVYISFPTELGTLYSRAELKELSEACREYGLPLYADGARLGYGLASDENDVTLPDLAAFCDIFTIGGTKQGALFGEAAVIANPALDRDFRYGIKQRGGMLAKGRLLGIQFLALLEKDLYFTLSRHADQLAMRIRDAFAEAGCDFLIASPTNQQFPILTQAQEAYLSEKFAFSFWCSLPGGREAVRVCTSWATREEDVQALLDAIKSMPAGS